MHAHAGFLARGEIHIEYADGCVVEYKAPQVVAIDPGHDGWVVGKEAVVLIEFDFEGDTDQPARHAEPSTSTSSVVCYGALRKRTISRMSGRAWSV